MKRITEQESLHDNLDQMSVNELLQGINQEDQKVANAVQQVIPQIEALVQEVIPRMRKGGRLFYLGAGTSGRLGVVDASECPPTFGVDHDMVIGIIAGGDSAIREAVEFAEDNETGGFKDLEQYNINVLDTVIGIAASGTTPYVVGALKKCNSEGILTSGITNNPNAPISEVAQFPIEVIVGPEFVTGSTRMKSGTSQKLVLNMISTTIMIQLGRVKGNRMVDMQLSNNKLVNRGTLMVQKALNIDYLKAESLLLEYGSVRKAIASQLPH
jgi:N-acetylmuramic acid 6-phosphate etherase